MQHKTVLLNTKLVSKKKNKIDGWLVIDKPLGLTSTRLGQIIKRLWRPEKIGHIGTLDPLASGVLVMAIGEATKLIPYITSNQKTYEFHVTFGEARSTDDVEGDIIQTSEIIPAIDDIQKILPKFEGVIDQVPPIYSAIHINGERAYKMARKGQNVDMPLRLVRIDFIKCTGAVNSNTYSFEVQCGQGTYVRSLARDMAYALGTVGHVSFLRRTQDGIFSIKHTIKLEILEKEPYNSCVMLPLSFVLDDIPAITINEADYKRLHHGLSISYSKLDLSSGQLVRLEYEKMLCAMGVVDGMLIAPKRIIHIGENDVDYS